MKELEAIHLEIMRAPTVMDLQMEYDFCNRLSRLHPKEIETQWNLAADIFGRLQESHLDAFYEMAPTDDFLFFTAWLKMLADAS